MFIVGKPELVQFINNKRETNNEYLLLCQNRSKHRNIFQAWKLGVSFSVVVPHLVFVKSRFIPNTSNVWHVYAYLGCIQPQFPRIYLQRSQCEPYLKCQHILNVFVIHFMLFPKPNLDLLKEPQKITQSLIVPQSIPHKKKNKNTLNKAK